MSDPNARRRARGAAFALLLAVPLAVPLAVLPGWGAPSAAAPSTRLLSDLAVTGTPANGWGPFERDSSNGENDAGDGRPITLGGVVHQRGLGVHASSDLGFALGGGCSRLTASIGVDDEVADHGSVVFRVLADGAVVFESPVLTGTSATRTVDVDVTGVDELRLVVGDGGDGAAYDHADWADAALRCDATVAATPFAPAVDLPSGNGTHGVLLADVVGDRHLDLVATNALSSTVGVRPGDGTGSFGSSTDYPTGDTPKSTTIGDVTGDGRPDLVTANQAGNSISVLRALPGGGFAAHVDHPACTGTHEVALGDVDGDRDLDVVAACWGGSVLSVLRNDGTGGFAPKVNYPTGDAPHSVVLVRLDAGPSLDIAVADHSSGTVSILLGRGDGTFGARTAYPVGSQPHSLRADDLDGDGDLDLVSANDASDDVSVLLGTGAGTFAAAVGYPAGPTPKGVAIADVSGDGVPDVLTADINGNYPTCCEPGGNLVSVLVGDGDGTFGDPTQLQVGESPFSIAAGDIDGDGDLDLATANYHSGDVSVLRNLTVDGTPATTKQLSDRPTTGTPVNGFGPFERDRSNGEGGAADGGPIRLDGVTYAKGLGVHAGSDLRFDLGGTCTSFSAVAGVDDEVGDRGTVVAEVWVDGTRIERTRVLTGAGPAVPLALSLPDGARQLRLVVTNAGDGGDFDHADWADARLVCDDAVPTTRQLSGLPTTGTPVNGFGPFERNRSNGEGAAGDGGPITLNGAAHTGGLGVHARSDLAFDLGGTCSRFTADVGVDDEVASRGSVVFEVWADGTRLRQTAVLTGSSPTVSLDVPLPTGAQQLRLVVTNGGDDDDSDHGDWADATVTCT